MLAADVNNDGRDELVVSTEHRLEVLRGDLQQIWSLPQDIHRAGFVYLPLADATPTLAIQPLRAWMRRTVSRAGSATRDRLRTAFSPSHCSTRAAPRGCRCCSRRVPSPSATRRCRQPRRQIRRAQRHARAAGPGAR